MGVAAGAKLAALVALLMCFVPATAAAERTRVDWQRGLLIARGIAVGDLRSPSRQLARVKAERQAKERCRKLLLATVGSIGTASGKKTAVAARGADTLLSLADSILPLHTDYGTDGSVVVEMALPLDALRALLHGPDPLQSETLEGPTALLIDVRSLRVKPALGYLLDDGTDRYRGPTLFFTDEKAARADRRIGKRAALLLPKKSSAGVLRLEPGALQSLLAARPLVAILWKEGK